MKANQTTTTSTNPRRDHRFQHHIYDTPPTFIDVCGEVEKVDLIESPQSTFKGTFDEQVPRPVVNHRVLGTVGMVAITYLYSCGGPVGSEPVVSAGGPLIGMGALLIYPLIVTIPYAFIVAELCSAFPEDGGFTIWVLNAFGPFWAFQVGYWSWIAGVVRSALMPGVIMTLIYNFYNVGIKDELLRYVVKAAMALTMALPTALGSAHVSRAGMLIMTVVILPFLIYIVWAYTQARDFDDLFEVRKTDSVYNPGRADVEAEGEMDVRWTELVNTLYYKFDGIYMVSVFGGEVMNPARTYPRAIFFTVALTVATYLLPLPASIVADSLTWLQFDRDAYPTMAKDIGGSTLNSLILVASVCGALGTFMMGIYMQSFQICGMASNRLLPAPLAHRSSWFEAPIYAILLTTVVVMALVRVHFDDLQQLSNAFAASVEFMIVIAAMRLRMTLPYIPRPTKVPGGVPGLMVLATIPVAFMGYIIVNTFLNSLLATCLLVGLAVLGLLYGVWAVRWS